MKTLNLGISMNQGDDFNVVITLNGVSGPIDITGYEFLGEMKINTLSSSPVVAEFGFTILDQTTNLGQVQWSIPSSVTSGLVTSISDADQKQRLSTPFVFDIKMKDLLGNISRIIQGIIFVSPEVTQESFS